MNIGLRLRTICDMCEPAVAIADIGCDHGLTACTLALENKTPCAIAADVSEPSLNKARELAAKLEISERMRFLHGDGLCVLPGGFDGGVVISGMGAMTICEILKASPGVTKNAQYFVLSPNLQPEIVRQTLFELGFYIKSETIVREGKKLYPIMLAKHGKSEDYSPAEMILGKNSGEHCEEYAKLRINMLECAIKGDPSNQTARTLLVEIQKHMEES